METEFISYSLLKKTGSGITRDHPESASKC